MTREEAFRLIELYRGWNVGQKSMSYAFGGSRTVEDDIYDARRAALKKAHETLAQEEG